jgi:hypothetical protein
MGNMVCTPALRKQLNYVEGRVGMETDGVPQPGGSLEVKRKPRNEQRHPCILHMNMMNNARQCTYIINDERGFKERIHISFRTLLIR